MLLIWVFWGQNFIRYLTVNNGKLEWILDNNQLKDLTQQKPMLFVSMFLDMNLWHNLKYQYWTCLTEIRLQNWKKPSIQLVWYVIILDKSWQNNFSADRSNTNILDNLRNSSYNLLSEIYRYTINIEVFQDVSKLSLLQIKFMVNGYLH